MALSKKQKKDRLIYLVIMLLCLIFIPWGLISFLGSESKPDQVHTGTRTLMNADSLEIANPWYMEKYFEKW